MCTTCGCGSGEAKVEGLAVPREGPHDHAHPHGHDHDHDHGHGPGHEHHHHHGHSHAPGVGAARAVAIEEDILAENGRHAAANRRALAERGVFALNLVSSPGSGKTALLVDTIRRLGGELVIAVIEGDQQTSNDAERIRRTGARAIQINTGKGCHLDAHMVGHAIEHLEPAEDSVLMIENVGNLVCPAAFDLGESHKVVVLSVTEGEDKPLKYPDMFAAADLMLLNKCDLLPHLAFDVEACVANARRINPRIEVLRVSATTGEGLDAWLDWVRRGARTAKAARSETVAALKSRVAVLEAQLAARRSAA